MGEKVKPKTSMDFVLIGKGIQFFMIESTNIEPVKESDDESKKEKNDKNFMVVSRVQGGEDDGTPFTLWFPHISKGHFGLARVFGFMQKCGVMTDKTELDVEFFDSKEFETGWRMKMPKRTWAANIIHKSGTKKNEDGSVNTFANVQDFYTVKEAQEKLKEGTGKPAGTAVGKETPTDTGKQSTPSTSPASAPQSASGWD